MVLTRKFVQEYPDKMIWHGKIYISKSQQTKFKSFKREQEIMLGLSYDKSRTPKNKKIKKQQQQQQQQQQNNTSKEYIPELMTPASFSASAKKKNDGQFHLNFAITVM